MRTVIYCVCANIKVRDNNIRECAPFAKFAKIIDREHFVTYGRCSFLDHLLNSERHFEDETSLSETSLSSRLQHGGQEMNFIK